jgi:signal transduction histidine kinase
MRPPTPPDEAERLRALYELKILDTPPEPDFDDMVRLASYICDTPISLVNLIDRDRQWSKARHGIEEDEIPRDVSFCAHAILGGDLMVVPDATADARFADNPLVGRQRGIRFYAGAPLITTEGYALGALCVIDAAPRRLARPQLKALRALSQQVIAQLELRRFMALMARGSARLRELERHLDDLSRLAGRLREPLSALLGWLTVPGDACARDAVIADAGPLHRLLDDLLALVEAAPPAALRQREVDLSPLTQRAADAVRPIADAKHIPVLCTSVTPTLVRADPVRLEQALSHLLFNAVKYTPEGGRLEVTSGLEAEPTVRVRNPDLVAGERPGLFGHVYRGAAARGAPEPGAPDRGLAAVKAVFDAHHATMALYDRPGDGTSLHVVFPAPRD